MEPAASFFCEDQVPIDLARLQLRYRRMSAVRAAYSCAQTESTFSEIQTVADRAPDSIMSNPLDVGLIHSTLIDKILYEASDGIVSECGHNGSTEAEASFQAACDVVFATTFPGVECPCVRDPALARIKTQHDLAQR